MARPHAPLPLAIVIEPHATLADTLAEALRTRGYEVLVAASHSAGATSALDHAVVDFLIAAVPAPGEDRSGAFLARARQVNPVLRTIVLLSDPNEDAWDAPPGAIRLIKPFAAADLDDAIGRALAAGPRPWPARKGRRTSHKTNG